MRTFVETFTITDSQLAHDIMHGLREQNPNKEMTLSEIEKKLGCNIKLISEAEA